MTNRHPLNRMCRAMAASVLGALFAVQTSGQTAPATGSRPASKPATTAAAKDSPEVTQANVKQAQVTIVNIETALDAFEIDNGRYPTSAEGLAALIMPPANLANSWKGPYIRRVTADPWGNPFIYRCPSTRAGSGFDLVSAGADGKEGTNDDLHN